VFICPGIEVRIGNIKKLMLSKIITSSELLKKVRKMPKVLSGKCASCEFEACSYGCRLEAYAKGDLFGEDPLCWH